MTGPQADHPADPPTAHGPVQVVPLQLPPGVGAGPDRDRGHGPDEMVPGGTGDTLGPIPEAGPGRVGTGGTGAGTMPGTTGGTGAPRPGTGHAAGPGLVEDPITEGPTQGADHVQEAEDITDLGEQYILRYTGAGGADHEQDLGVGHLSI